MKKIALSLIGAITVLTMVFGTHTKPTTDSKLSIVAQTDSKPISIAAQSAHGDTG